mmetsp:Transcript_41065/g.95953  ORF Transcript_41065/g.95953 Transcript_41065/m.95953 type:complete len:105 (+) Transcript_41065:547-861(+)
MGTFIALTLFTMQSKIDWSFLGSGLYAALWVLIIWGFMAWLLGFRTGFLFALFGSLVFCGYIIYDTNNICKKFTPDEYIIGTISLYLDVINLFLCILAMGRRAD